MKMPKIKPYHGAGIALFYDGLLLLGKRKYHPGKGKWSFPGGGMEKQDRGNYEKCALREMREEINIQEENLDIKRKSFIKYNLNIFQWETHIYFLNNKPFASNIHEFSEMKWIPINELRNYDLHFGVMKAVRAIKRQLTEVIAE
jgi:8-oxo-dGTP pyrophosphatase MutT (NUDIX family)